MKKRMKFWTVEKITGYEGAEVHRLLHDFVPARKDALRKCNYLGPEWFSRQIELPIKLHRIPGVWWDFVKGAFNRHGY